ncbi:MAG: cupin domain-containing protein [Rhodospirillales bacterium]
MSAGGAPDAAAIIRRLGLKPHPEGGHYREVYRHKPGKGGRGLATSIYYLLARGEVSAWHRLTDAVEIWHWHGGGPLELSVAAPGALAQIVQLGPDVTLGHEPQAVVPVGHWQSARPLSDWTLVGCTVAPAFEFSKFELAPKGFRPGR